MRKISKVAQLLFLNSILSITFFTGYAQTLSKFHVKAVELITISQEDSLKMIAAINVFEKVMNDCTFQRALLDTSFLFDLPEDPMRYLSTMQIVDSLYSGREWYHTTADNTANIFWECNRRKHKPPFTTAIGYGLEEDSVIRTYIYFVRNYDLPSIANNLAHEWSHKVGFDHQKKDHGGRDQTVPYLFGNLVERFAKKYATQIK